MTIPTENSISAQFDKTNRKEYEDFVVKACISGNTNVVEDYLASNKNVNELLSSNWNLLLYASSYAQQNMVKYLLEVGADPNSQFEGYTPLMALSQSESGTFEDRMDCLKLLVNAKADVDATNKFKETALMFACQKQDMEYISLLITHSININVFDNEGRSALFYAVMNNRYDVTKLLIEKGADLTITNSYGHNAFDIAVTKDFKDIIPLVAVNKNVSEDSNPTVQYFNSWKEVFSLNKQIDKNHLDPAIESILYGMGLEYYNKCFKGLEVTEFLNLNDEDLKKRGVDIGIHRSKFKKNVYKFHIKNWNPLNIGKMDPRENFKMFDGVRSLGNIIRQIEIMTCSLIYAKKAIPIIEKTEGDKDKVLAVKKDISDQLILLEQNCVKVKQRINQLHNFAEVFKKIHADETMPIYIHKKVENRFVLRKWIFLSASFAITAAAGIYFFKKNLLIDKY